MSGTNTGVVVLTSGSNARAGGGFTPCWMSGDVSGLAGSGNVNVIFDLGASWDSYGKVALAVQGTQQITSITPYGSDDGATNAAPLLNFAGSAQATGTLAAAGTALVGVLPSGRYLIVAIANGASAQGTAHVRATLYPAS